MARSLCISEQKIGTPGLDPEVVAQITDFRSLLIKKVQGESSPGVMAWAMVLLESFFDKNGQPLDVPGLLQHARAVAAGTKHQGTITAPLPPDQVA